jgi:hypothetical protein
VRSIWSRPIATPIVVVALGVIGLNLVDGFATLRHVDCGAIEVNPLMRMLIARGPTTFLVGKHLLASGGVIGIVAYAHHRAARVMLIGVLFPIYLALALYQMALFLIVW